MCYNRFSDFANRQVKFYICYPLFLYFRAVHYVLAELLTFVGGIKKKISEQETENATADEKRLSIERQVGHISPTLRKSSYTG